MLISGAFANAQGDTPQKDPASGNIKAAGTAIVTGEKHVSPTDRVAAASKAIEFTEVGKDVASPSVKLPAGAELVRQLSAALANGKGNVLLNWYKVGGQLWVDIYTSQENQAWVKRNHVAMKAAMPIRPDKMAMTMRYILPGKREGFLLVASDESADLALMLPKGFGGPVGQQVFLIESKDGTRHSYDFGDLDGRGYAIVRETVDGTGQVKPADDTQYFVWNGRTFIPRHSN